MEQRGESEGIMNTEDGMSNTPELESCLVSGFVPSKKGGEIQLPTCVHCHVANSTWHVREPFEERAEKLLRRGRVAAARPQHVEDVVVLIDRAPPGMPLAMHG